MLNPRSNSGEVNKYALVLILFALSMITYVDRVCISGAKGSIAGEMGLSDTAMGLAFSAFALGYAVAQIPSGWLADRFGPRLILTAVVGLWSFLTALTGSAWNLPSLVAIRFLFGIGEAGAFPGATRAICDWLPEGERGRANGILFSGTRLGGAVSFPLLAWMLARWNWRSSFRILGGLGLCWAILWFLWFRNRPAAGRQRGGATDQQSAASSARIWHRLRSRPMLLAVLQYFASNFTFFLGLSWMLPYLQSQFHLSRGDAAEFAMAPLLAGTLSQWIAGWMVDSLFKSRYRAWSRRIPAMSGFALSAIGIIALMYAATPWAASACFTLAVFGSDMTVSPSWVYCADIAGRDTGSVSGAMNMIGSVGSFASANAFPLLREATGSASAYFWIAAALNVISIGCWAKMRSPERPAVAPPVASCLAGEA